MRAVRAARRLVAAFFGVRADAAVPFFAAAFFAGCERVLLLALVFEAFLGALLEGALFEVPDALRDVFDVLPDDREDADRPAPDALRVVPPDDRPAARDVRPVPVDRVRRVRGGGASSSTAWTSSESSPESSWPSS